MAPSIDPGEMACRASATCASSRWRTGRGYSATLAGGVGGTGTTTGGGVTGNTLDATTAGPGSIVRPGASTVGAGLTGIEAATELVDKMNNAVDAGKAALPNLQPHVILADRKPYIGSDMGESARPVIEQALASLGIEARTSITVACVDQHGVTLSDGERIPAATVVWCSGMRTHQLTEQFPVDRDQLGRISVDEFMRVRGLENVFAAGDAAQAMFAGHPSVMSCQHSRPMGRFAGHNVVADLLGEPMLPLNIDWYVTVLDLGAWGAVYTHGWDRRVVSTGQAAKRTKQIINCERIYPPRTRDRQAILAMAAPVVQAAPQSFE